MKTFFLCGAYDWIIKYITDDICRELLNRGYTCRSGSFDDYNNEDICFHMWWRLAQPIRKAKHNSVFITHIDDICKEIDLKRLKGLFDSYICMSSEDAQFLVELGFDKEKVFGVSLPIRSKYIKPLNIGIFSNAYPDNRKNESWLLDYCNSRKDAVLINFVFIGMGWAKVCENLSSIKCSFEWHYASRVLPYEYMFQQLKLQYLDCYMYMGMDGGAMGSYDAYAMGVPLCISDDGYHKNIPCIDFRFETKEEFFSQMDLLVQKQRARVDFFANNNIVNYVNKLLNIWNGHEIAIDNSNLVPKNFGSVLEKRRYNYFKLTFKRFIQMFITIYNRRRVIK